MKKHLFTVVFSCGRLMKTDMTFRKIKAIFAFNILFIIHRKTYTL